MVLAIIYKRKGKILETTEIRIEKSWGGYDKKPKITPPPKKKMTLKGGGGFA